MSHHKELINSIDKRKAEFIKISDAIWDFAEIRYQEFNSSDILCRSLESEGFTITKKIAGLDTAFMATFGSGKPVIGFLGEYDALSNMSQKAGIAHKEPIKPDANGHGCGHHALGTGTLAAAIALKDYIQKHNIPATIRYYGCPAEEGGSGKTYIARDGFFDDLDVALTWHPGDMNEIMMSSTLANIQAYFKFYGVSAHAASAPHLGRSALDAAELMNVGVNYLREHIIPQARLHYAMLNTGGTSPNVVQPYACSLYLIRAPKPSDVNELYVRVKDIARGAALMTQTKVEIVFDKGTSNLIPSRTLTEVINNVMQKHAMFETDDAELEFAKQIIETFTAEEKADMVHAAQTKLPECGVENYIANDSVRYTVEENCSAGSSDVGDISWIVPTAQFSASCMAFGTPGHSWQLVAQGKSSLMHKGMLSAAKILSCVALDLLENPETIIKAKEELKKRLNGNVYSCPIPSDVSPAFTR